MIYSTEAGRQEDVAEWLGRLYRREPALSFTMPYAASWFLRGDSAKAVQILGDRRETDLPVALMLPDTGKEGVSRAREIYKRMQGGHNPLTRLYSLYIPLILGQQKAARDDAQALRHTRPAFNDWQQWRSRLLDYHCGLISDDQLLEAAGKSNSYRCGAFFSIGLWRLAEGNHDAARASLRRCLATRFPSLENAMSDGFLRRMDKDPLWPPWIPTRPETQPTSPSPTTKRATDE